MLRLVCTTLLLLPILLQAAAPVNMPLGVSDVSNSVYGLHMTIFWICVAIAVFVFAVMLWSMYFHRKSRGVTPAKFKDNHILELIWTLIPAIILAVMVFPAAKVMVQMYDTSNTEINIKVTGYQWKWKYEYLEDGISFFSNLSTPRDQIYGDAAKGENYLLEVDKPLVLPTGKKVRFLITSNDVLHSWWLPDLAIKRDAVPGFINETWTEINEPGIYRGQCAELCGTDHGFMPIVIEAKSPEDYQEWLAREVAMLPQVEEEESEESKNWDEETLTARGEEVYINQCSVCHQSNGLGLPPAFPALSGSAIVNAENIDVFAEQIIKGKNVMPSFGGLLSDADIAAVMTYIRKSWINQADAITPEEITLQRNK